MNSKIGKGQTIGKKLLKIKVVDRNGDSIGLLKSFFRYAVLAIPFFLNGAPFSDKLMFSFAVYILSLFIFGGLFSIIYLYLFNRVTRQSLHDIASGTYVVNVAIEKQPVDKIWKPHYVIVCLFLIGSLVVPFFTSRLAKQEPFLDLFQSRTLLMENQVVQNATISYGKSTFSSTSSGPIETKYVSAQVYLSRDETLNEELAKSFAITIVENDPDALAKDKINITLIYGFDIVIASRSNSHGYRFNPTELLNVE